MYRCGINIRIKVEILKPKIHSNSCILRFKFNGKTHWRDLLCSSLTTVIATTNTIFRLTEHHSSFFFFFSFLLMNSFSLILFPINFQLWKYSLHSWWIIWLGARISFKIHSTSLSSFKSGCVLVLVWIKLCLCVCHRCGIKSNNFESKIYIDTFLFLLFHKLIHIMVTEPIITFTEK